MPSITDWITAIATVLLAVMACLTVNGTYRFPRRTPAPVPPPPPPDPSASAAEVSLLRDQVRDQAAAIKLLQEQHMEALGLVGDLTRIINSKRY